MFKYLRTGSKLSYIGQNRSHFLADFRITRQGVIKLLAVVHILQGEPLTSCLDVFHIDAGFGSYNIYVVSFEPQRISRADIGYSVAYHMLLPSKAQHPNVHWTPLCGAQWLLADGLYERLQSNDRLIRGDFVASLEHVQEREFARSLERAVLHALDGVRHQRRPVELG